ncbi:MAG TPA: bacterial ammonia monooxygenase, subunit AmoC [Candidatus Binatia bacterium]|nr:bacterial ammonia monooxygenase, subunit AmoC [Candidatus Binatia bacterium]
MATVASATAGARTNRVEVPLAQRVLNVTNIWMGLAGITVVMVAARIYQQLFAFSKGVDSFSPEFRTYWWNLLLTEWGLEVIAAALLWGWLWKTRDRELDKLAPEVELKRYFNTVMWLMAYAFVVIFAASVFAEQDATWHQTLIRDTQFTPNHIILQYFTFPFYIILGVGGLLYAHTRLPYYDYRKKGWSLPYLWVVVGPALILVNVAFNEWGHTFWIMEEFFAAPLHWGFVVLGWTALGFFGVFLQIVPRMLELIRELGKSAALDKSAA